MAQTAPIFKPLKSKFKPLGVPIARFAAIVGTCLAGLLAAYLMGGIQFTHEVAYTQPERQALFEELLDCRRDLQKAELACEDQGAETLGEASLSDATREGAETALRLGISSGSTDAEVAELTPARHTVTFGIGSMWQRVALLVGLPAVVGFGLFIEIRGTSLYSELTRMLAWRRSQKTYRNLPMTYAERACGKPYMQVVSDARRR